MVGIDLEDPLIAAEWAKRPASNSTYRPPRENPPFADGEFDIATLIEVRHA